MSRLRQLGLGVGVLDPGATNSLSDVAGVGVGHSAVADEGLYTGLTAVVPYLAAVKERRLFIGRHALDGGGAMTGLGVAEDFGTFSSPIVLAPTAAVGRVYDGGIAYGIRRDPGLGTYTGWPPVVVGVDDGVGNDASAVWRSVGQRHLEEALTVAAGGNVAEGDVGIGRSLAAFGLKGGVGTASRQSGGYTVGVLVAAGGGDPHFLAGGRFVLPEGIKATAGSYAAVVATDAPLIPLQLDRLAQRAFVGLVRVGLVDAVSQRGTVLAFSTAVPGAQGQTQMVGEGTLGGLSKAAAESCEEAVLNALLAAGPARGLAALPLEALRGGRGE